MNLRHRRAAFDTNGRLGRRFESRGGAGSAVRRRQERTTPVRHTPVRFKDGKVILPSTNNNGQSSSAASVRLINEFAVSLAARMPDSGRPGQDFRSRRSW